MPWFHVTFDRHLSSILRHGLGGRVGERNYPGAQDGVYLGRTPEIAITMLVEWLLVHGNDQTVPREFQASMRLIVIDDTRIDPRWLHEDESFPGDLEVRRYAGIIDVVGMPILTMDEALHAQDR